MCEQQPVTASASTIAARSLDNPWVMAMMLFLVTGAVGIPLLWASRAFSLSGKLLMTVAVSLYTACVCGIFWLVLVWAYQQLTYGFGLIVG